MSYHKIYVLLISVNCLETVIIWRLTNNLGLQYWFLWVKVWEYNIVCSSQSRYCIICKSAYKSIICIGNWFRIVPSINYGIDVLLVWSPCWLKRVYNWLLRFNKVFWYLSCSLQSLLLIAVYYIVIMRNLILDSCVDLFMLNNYCATSSNILLFYIMIIVE